MIKSLLRQFGFYPREWVPGLSHHGGRSLVCLQTGKVLGHVYQLAGQQYWAVTQGDAIGSYKDEHSARKAVEKTT